MRGEVKKRERRKERGKGKKKVGRGNRKGRKTVGIDYTQRSNMLKFEENSASLGNFRNISAENANLPLKFFY